MTLFDWLPSVRCLHTQLAAERADRQCDAAVHAVAMRERDRAIARADRAEADALAARTLATDLESKTVHLRAQLADAYVRGAKGRMVKWSATEQEIKEDTQKHA